MKKKIDFRFDEDICTHFADEPSRYMGAVTPPIFATSIHAFETMEDMGRAPNDGNGRYIYGRTCNPTVEVFEKKMAALERTDMAVAFGSGAGGISAVLSTYVSAGDHIVIVESAYGSACGCVNQLGRFNVASTFVSGWDIDEIIGAIRPETRLVYLESPSSMTFTLQDLWAVAQYARPRGILTAVDNSWATPLHQKPATMGVDIVLHTVSKYIAGHSDMIGGVVCGSEELMKKLRENRGTFGAIMSPFDAFLATRGLRTLPIRLAAHEKAAMKIACYLERRPRVEKVLYPALESHPQHVLFMKQMTGSCGPFTFVLKDSSPQDAVRLVDNLKYFHITCSWGGYESLAIAFRIDAESSTGRFYDLHSSAAVRIHVGTENMEMLIDDLAEALEQL